VEGLSEGTRSDPILQSNSHGDTFGNLCQCAEFTVTNC
jgi:hypothetical protein